MLQRIETEKCQARHVLVRRVNAKDAALVLWPVAPYHEITPDAGFPGGCGLNDEAPTRTGTSRRGVYRRDLRTGIIPQYLREHTIRGGL
jgi:hypothetical protein